MPYKQEDFVRIFRSFDMGYEPDPAYCLWIAHLGNRYIAFKEKRWNRTVALDIARDILEESEGMRVSMTYCDPTLDLKTGADVRTIKDIFEDAGVPMECSINNREFYAHYVHSALAEEVEPGIPKLQIYAPGCPYLIRTLPLQRFDPKHPLKMADHHDDHAVVALAYFLISGAAVQRKQFVDRPLVPKWMRPKPGSRHVLGSESVHDLR